jgi:uncharacterized protein YjbI with pentapeptide repeats
VGADKPIIENDSALKFAWVVGRVPPHALSATFVLKGTFDLNPGGVMTPAEEPLPVADEVFFDDDETKSLRYPGDFALFKPHPDVFLVGDGVSPGEKPTTVLRVEFKVGGFKKTLAVIGNRTWSMTGPSKPEPFKSMPLRWENSFGGEGYGPNPLGKGREGRLLPNLENPNRLITTKNPPAAPGTYGGRYLKEDWPWFPKDFDWSNFNAAPEDQRPKNYLRGDEKLRITHMHPDHPVFECALPGLRPRWFVRQAGEKDVEKTYELRLHLDTLWVDMENLQAVLVWRAVHPVTNRKLKDVKGHFIVGEKLADEPGSRDAYREDFEARVAAAKKPDPKVEAASKAAPPGKEEKALAEAVEERREFDRARRLEEARLFEYLEKRGKAHEGAMEVIGRDNRGELSFLGPVLAYFQGISLKYPEIAKEVGPPPMPDEELYDALIRPEPPWTRRKVAAFAPKGFDFSEQDLSNLDLSDLDLSGALMNGTALAGAKLVRTKLVGAELEGADLSKADLTEANLSEAKLASTDLTKARLAKATLGGADLEGASFEEALLEKADLSKSKAKVANFTKADLTGAALPEAVLEMADFSEARLKGADFSKADLTSASFTAADGPGVVVKEAKIEGLRAEGANLQGARFRLSEGKEPIFKNAVVDGADFFACKIPRAVFTGASAREALFSTGILKNAVFDDAVLTEAKALKTDLFQASFDSADLTKGDFRGSNLYQAAFFEAKTKGCLLDRANVKGTLLA